MDRAGFGMETSSYIHCASYENSAISKNKVTFPLKFVENCGRKKFIKYLTTVSRLSCDNDKVTIDLRRTSNLLSVLRRKQGFS